MDGGYARNILFGSAHEYATPALITQEKGTFECAMVEKNVKCIM